MFKHFKLWNDWRKHNLNNTFHKILVLFGIIKSPTFESYKQAKVIYKFFMEGFEKGLEEGEELWL